LNRRRTQPALVHGVQIFFEVFFHASSVLSRGCVLRCTFLRSEIST